MISAILLLPVSSFYYTPPTPLMKEGNEGENKKAFFLCIVELAITIARCNKIASIIFHSVFVLYNMLL